MAKKPDIAKLQLRLAEPLRRKLERAAAQSERSMNAEIIHRLEQSFTGEAVDIIEELEKMYKKQSDALLHLRKNIAKELSETLTPEQKQEMINRWQSPEEGKS